MSGTPEPIPPKPKRFSDLRLRAISGLTIAAICFIPIYFGGPLFAVFAGLIAARIAFEWVRMSDPKAPYLAYTLMITGIVVAVTLSWLQFWIAMWIVIGVTAIVVSLERAARHGWSGSRWPWAFWGVLYLVLPSIAMVFVRTGLYVPEVAGWESLGLRSFFWILLIVIAADTGAYLGGSLIGGPKIAPKLSPKKTWAGFFSGLVFGTIIGALFAQIIDIHWINGALLAAPVVVLSVIGDFLESWFKRKLKVKDTGRILPGHGGVLDRIDSLMFAMAAFAGLAIMLPFIG